MVGSRFITAGRYFVDLTLSLPFNIPRLLITYMSSKTDFVYSNVPGPRNGYNFGGTMLTIMVLFLPIGGYSANELIFSSLKDTA